MTNTTFEPQVTIVVVPRERFSYTQKSLESLYKNTTVPFKLVYVDGNSPKHIKCYLETQSQLKGFDLIRSEQYLFPNQARNLGLAKVDTKYVLFVDNDVLFTPNWLEKLVQCAEETGAWVVGPLYLEGEPEKGIIHMAGGVTGFHIKHGVPSFYERHLLAGRKLDKVQSKLKRQEILLVEWHCVFARTDTFEKIGMLDEGFMSVAEHVDLCMSVRQAGGKVYFEPDSAIAYVPPTMLALSDYTYYFLRWGEAWGQVSMERLCQKWNVAQDDPFIPSQFLWLKHHRNLAFKPLRDAVRNVWHWKNDSMLKRYIVSPIQQSVDRLLISRAGKQA
jgi:GT2 family glycosyltransferase